MPRAGGARRGIRWPMRAEKVMLTVVAIVLFAAFVAILVLPHHAPS